MSFCKLTLDAYDGIWTDSYPNPCALFEPYELELKATLPTRKTNPIHNDVAENATFLLLDQPSREANTTATLISKIDELGTKFPLNQQTHRPALVIGTHKP